MEEKGLLVAGFRRRSNCVRDHRKPDNADAKITSIKPIATNCASLATIITTPIVMTEMTETSFQVTFSNRNKKAKTSTNANEDDLHMALETSATLLQRGLVGAPEGKGCVL